MSAKGWKTKLTTKQLENKRLGDRQRQQKLRQDRENSAMRMERQLKLALSQNESDEVKAINEENAALRAQVVQLKAALRKISSLATGLQQGLESVTPTLEMIPVHPLGDVYAEERPLGVLQRERSALRRCSIVRRVAQAAVANGRLEDLLSYGDGFIDCALSWKLLQGHRLGLMFLVDSPDCTSSRGKPQSQLNRLPYAEFIPDIHFIHDQNFHTQLIRRITHLEPIVMPQATSNPLQESSKKTLSIFDIQDRQIAFHTLKVLEPYLPRLRSSVDRILHFWILYSFSRVRDSLQPWHSRSGLLTVSYSFGRFRLNAIFCKSLHGCFPFRDSFSMIILAILTYSPGM